MHWFARFFGNWIVRWAPVRAEQADIFTNAIPKLLQDGKLDDALLGAQRALIIRERVFGREHPAVGVSLRNLGAVRATAGQLDVAKGLLERSVSVLEKALGPDHAELGGALNLLAEVYLAQDLNDEAEKSYRRSLAILQKSGGGNTYPAAKMLNHLGVIHLAKGRYEEAESALSSSLIILETFSGAEQLEAAKSLNNLAMIHRARGEFAQAEAAYNRALTKLENGLGKEDPLVAVCLLNIGALYIAWEHLDQAETAIRRSLAIQERTDPVSAQFGATLTNLAMVYHNQGRTTEAEPLYKRGLSIREQALGKGHRDVGTSLTNVGLCYYSEQRYAEAEPFLKRGLAVTEKALGGAHPDVGGALSNLGIVYHAQRRFAEAEAMFQRSLTIYEKAFTREHPHVATILHNLALLYDDQQKHTEAASLYERVLVIREKSLGPNSAELATTLNNLAKVYEALARAPEAEDLYRRALAILDVSVGPEHRFTAMSLVNLGALYRKLGRLAEAEATFERALAVPDPATKEITVVYTTNRQRDDVGDLLRFGSKRAKHVTVGEARVLVPKAEVMRRAQRRAEGSGLLDTSAGELTSAARLAVRKVAVGDGEDRLARSTSQILERAKLFKSHALVFVHGFNVNFEDGLISAAKIAYDLEFDGPVVLFSWPSAGWLFGYWYDGKSASTAVDHLVKTIDDLVAAMPATKLHLAAHSMGNRVLFSALEKIAARDDGLSLPGLGEIISAHSDAESDKFVRLAAKLKPHGLKITLYASSGDKALWVSRLVNLLKGRAGAGPVFADGVDAIDITGLGRLWDINHGIYSANPIVSGDITRLIATGKRPVHERTPLFKLVDDKRGIYWRYLQ